MRGAVALVVLAACGDDAPAPGAVLEAGGVTITTADLSLTVGPLAIDHFLSIGTVDEVVETHYYDPRGEDQISIAAVDRATAQEGEWTVLEGGARIRIAPCEGIANCAALDVDASRVPRAVLARVTLPRPGEDPLYGTGDAAVRANVAGTIREMQLRLDPASESGLNEVHVPVPLVTWPRSGVGMLVADDRPGALDLAATDPDRVHATFNLPVRGAFRVYLWTVDPTQPLDLVRTYTSLTTKPAVPPRWAFAPQQWRNVWTSSDEVRGDADEMRARHIPGSVMWIDNPWQTGYNTLIFDEQRFVDPPQLFADLEARGYKVVMWSTPYVGSQTPATAADRAEGAALGYFVTRDGGSVFDVPWANGPGALVDFTAPGATAWWQERIARVTALGAAGFKLDFAEEVVPDVNGTIVTLNLAAGDNSVMHNRYAAGYHAAYLGALPAEDKFLITRAGAWGEQDTNPTIWPGDLDSDFGVHGVDDNGKYNIGGLPSAIARGLALSASGYPFYGSDIGGFNDFPTTETLLRWAAYAAYGTIMQLGGGGKSHDPWDTTLFDPGADVIYKRFAEQHMLLNPYLWTLAQAAGADGTPATRPARFAYDCACDDAMFLLGDDVLVAPVIVAGATTREVVLPPGSWHRPDGSIATSGQVAAPLDVIPVFYRGGSLVPMFAKLADTLLPATAAGVTSYATAGVGDELRLVWTPGAPATVRVHDGLTAMADGGNVTVTGGSEYRAVTVDTARAAAPTSVLVDGTELTNTAGDIFACAAPGCWSHANGRLEVRVVVGAGQTRQVTIQ